jgi:hypothetical protein
MDEQTVMEEQTPATETPGTDPDVVEQNGDGEQPAHESGFVAELGSVPDLKRVLEAALLSSSEPLNVQQL